MAIQPDLFEREAKTTEDYLPAIPGLHYVFNFIDKNEQERLIDWVDQKPWRNDLKRRVQHYGYQYDYCARTVTADSDLGPLADLLQRLADQLTKDGIFDQCPDQVIIN